MNARVNGNALGDRIRELRKSKGYSLRKLAPLVGVGFSYLSKVERGRLDFDGSPSESLIHRLADVLGADESELLLLAKHIPPKLADRISEYPQTFQVLATCDRNEFLAIVERVGLLLRTRLDFEMSDDQIYRGIVHGNSVELLSATGLPDGAEVEVVIRSPEWTSQQQKQRLESLFGSCQEDAASLDAYLKAKTPQTKGR